ncbi:unnamed protein product [Cuscuta epithymum]|uniref:Reverse transcriptase zinc-binding domain-containing protein n=1 Tax=Cuscuta epithymum TaxID=186058 RepID=A0AAV0EVN7_9ASTE|nr:unnamed protein product [Cuscuta epithymum]
MPTYAMNVFLLPRDLCDEIEKLMNGFWWKGTKFEQRGIRWRRWELMCKPKGMGGLGFRKLREFNIAMLAKQGWRLLSNPESLMARVLKARYFPNSEFLKAKLGNNPSYIWRSIFETQGVLKENIRRRVGNGREVQVWADAWLPGPGVGRVQSAKPPGIADMNVAALRDSTGKKWNTKRIAAIFNNEERKIISSIPISLQDKQDGFWWSKENNGIFSVKSCYRVLMQGGEVGGWNGWKDLWELKIPPKIKYFLWQVLDGSLPSLVNLVRKGVPIQNSCKICLQGEETSEHALRSCPRAAEVWMEAGIATGNGEVTLEVWLQNLLSVPDKEKRCKVAMLVWGLWKRRNALVWEGNWQSSASVISSCSSMLLAWREAQQSAARSSSQARRDDQRWKRPSAGVIKINVDAAVDITRGVRAWGWIARDDQGDFVKAGGASCKAEWSPAESEAMGLREAVLAGISEGWDRVEIETDAQIVARGVQSSEGAAYIDLILDDIRCLVQTKSNYVISFCKRSANHAAHALARTHVTISDHSSSYDSIPDCIVSHVANDLLN